MRFESCDSKVALIECDSDGDSAPIFCDSTLLRFDSMIFASHCGNSGDSRPAILGIVRFAIRDSVSLRPRGSAESGNPRLSRSFPACSRDFVGTSRGSIPGSKGARERGRTLRKDVFLPCKHLLSGGQECLGEGRLGLPGQVWELRFLPSFPSFPRENRSSKNVWESVWKSQTSFFQTSAVFWF